MDAPVDPQYAWRQSVRVSRKLQRQDGTANFGDGIALPDLCFVSTLCLNLGDISGLRELSRHLSRS